MSHDHVQGLHRLEGHAGQPSGQSLVQILQADAGDALDGDLEAAVFAFAWDGHLQLHLCEGGVGGLEKSSEERVQKVQTKEIIFLATLHFMKVQ